MGECCTTPTGSREWTTEEMNAYLDWNRSEDERFQAVCDKYGDRIQGNRGPGYLWKMVEADMV